VIGFAEIRTTFTGSVLAGVDVPEFHTGATMERSGCPVFGIVADLASECGSIRVSHAIPSVTTYGKTRTPMLVHYGDETLNTPIEVNFTLPAAASVPDSVRFDLYRVDPSGATGALLQSRAWPSGIFASGRSKRIGFLGLFPAPNTITRFEVNVVLRYGSQQLPAAPRIRGEVAYVNRVESPFGAGWWMAGLEQLVPGQYDGSVLWIDGDGSTRKYADTRRTRPSDGAEVFLTRDLDGPDSLLYYPASGTYARLLPHRAYTQFNGAGQHVLTVDRFGRVTSFQYGGSVLSGITVPSPSGGVQYTVQNNGSGIVTSITAPAIGGQQRVVQLVRKPNGNGTLSRGVERLIDWHGSASDTVSFTFQPWALDFSYASRTDRRGTTVTLGAETNAPTLADAWVSDGSGQSVHHHWRTPHGFLTFPGADPEPVGEARYFYDGPRTDVGDTTSIWVDRWGAPVTIRNALGQTTAISRSNARFPALATSVTAPNGFLTTASYDGAGRILQQVAHGPYGDSRDAVTTYAYDGAWGDVTQVVGPEGETAAFGIDPSTGLRLWQQSGALGRAQFTYNTNRQVATAQTPGNSTLQLERYDYDAAGNLSRVTSPLGIAVQHVRDGLGRDTLVLTPTDAAQTPGLMRRDRTVYNTAGRVDSTIAIGAAMSYALRSTARDTATVEPDSAFTSNTYDAEGRLTSHLTRPSFSVWSNRRVSTSESWTYDALGRARVHVRNGFRDSTVFDLAGNAIQTTTATGRFLTQAFDPLNRLIWRVDTARVAPRQQCFGLLAGPITDPNVPTNCFVVFPAYPNATGSGYAISRDSATFQYDISGSLISADNADARIHRQYYPNGALRVDSVLYRAADGAGFTHGSRLGYHYDRAGRRDTLSLPDGRAMAFTYRPDNGALTTVVDPLANVYRYTYDPAGRVDSLIVGANGVTERRTYDADGRQYARQRVSAVFGQLNAEQLTFDAQGRVTIAAYGTRANQAPPRYDLLVLRGPGRRAGARAHRGHGQLGD
jgi:YD repeat-containing protein